MKSREEIWQLYQLSRTSMATFDAQTLISSIASKVQRSFMSSIVLFLSQVARASGTRSRSLLNLTTRIHFRPR